MLILEKWFLNTGLVSSQYHVVFDDTFSTVEFLRSKRESTNWEKLCKYHSEDYRMDMPNPQEAMQQEMESVLPSSQPLDGTEPGADDSQPDEYQPQEGERNILPQVSEGAMEDEFDINLDESNSHHEVPTQAPEGDHNLVGANDNLPESDQPEHANEPNQSFGRGRRNRRATSKMQDPNNLSLRQAMGLITSMFISMPECPKSLYTSFKAGIDSKLKSSQEKAMFHESAVEMNVDGSYLQHKLLEMKFITLVKQCKNMIEWILLNDESLRSSPSFAQGEIDL